MKRTIAWLLSLLICLPLCACAAKQPAPEEGAPAAFDAAAAAGSYDCILCNGHGEDADPARFTLVIDPAGGSRFADGESEYALTEIDPAAGLYGVGEQVYTLTDNRDGTLSLIALEGEESYLFALASLPEHRDEPAEEEAADPEGPDPLAGRYIAVAMVFGEDVYDRAYMERLAAEGTTYVLTLNDDGSGTFQVGEEVYDFHSRDRATGQLDVAFRVNANADGTLSMVRDDGGMELTLAPID